MLHGIAFVVMLAGKTKIRRPVLRDGLPPYETEASFDVRNEGFETEALVFNVFFM